MDLSVVGQQSHLLIWQRCHRILPVVMKDLGSWIFSSLPGFSPSKFLMRCKFSTHNSSTNGVILLPHVLTLSATQATIKILIFTRIELTTSALLILNSSRYCIRGYLRMCILRMNQPGSKLYCRLDVVTLGNPFDTMKRFCLYSQCSHLNL